MSIDPGAILTGIVLIVGAIVWLVRLEGRINLNDSRHEDITSRLIRIETKLDRSNGTYTYHHD